MAPHTFIKTLVLRLGLATFCLSSFENQKAPPSCTDFDRQRRSEQSHPPWFRSGWLEAFQKTLANLCPLPPKRGWTILPGFLCQRSAFATWSAVLPLWESIPLEARPHPQTYLAQVNEAIDQQTTEDVAEGTPRNQGNLQVIFKLSKVFVLCNARKETKLYPSVGS